MLGSPHPHEISQKHISKDFPKDLENFVTFTLYDKIQGLLEIAKVDLQRMIMPKLLFSL